MTATTLKEQAMSSTTRLVSKVITATRNMTAATGDVAYTGVGFTPTSLMVIANIEAVVAQSIGISDSAKTVRNMFQQNNSTYSSGAQVAFLISTAGNYQSAIVKTYDADGFTLTWTKTGSPTGTGYISFLCFK